MTSKVMVGDEVISKGQHGVVVDTSGQMVGILWVDKICVSYWSNNGTKKIRTGRHFSQIEEVFEQLRGVEE